MMRETSLQPGASLAQHSSASARAKQAHVDRVLSLAQPGDILTHTRCMGLVEEHRFTGMDGPWMCGNATTDTCSLAHRRSPRAHGAKGWTNDISPANVTHINRIPVDGHWPEPGSERSEEGRNAA